MGDDIKKGIVDNIGLLLGAAGAIFVAVRILAVSSYNVTTAKVLLETQGPTNVVVGTLVSGIPLLAMAAGGVSFLIAGWPWPPRLIRHRFWVAGALLLVVAASFRAIILAPILALLIALVMGAALFLRWLAKKARDIGAVRWFIRKIKNLRVVRWFIKKVRRHRRWPTFLPGTSPRVSFFHWFLLTAGFLTILGALGIMALRTEPWLPREQVTIRVEKPGVHFVSYLDGYVLEQSDTELVLLETDSDVNRTRLTESAQVTQRIYCDAPKSYHVPKLEDWLEEPPLSHWVAEDSDYEDCPD